MKRIAQGLLVILLLAGLMPGPAFAGDLMNIEFLQRRAREADPKIVRLSKTLQDGLYDKSPSLFSFVVNTLGLVAFTATYYTADTQATRDLGGLGGTLLYLPVLRDYLRARHANKQTQAMLAELASEIQMLDTRVSTLYGEMKAESVPARTALVDMTSEAVVAEVETNLRLERMLQTIDRPNTGSQP